MCLLHALIDILLPSRCVSCDKPVSFSRRNLCEGCEGAIVPVRNPCPVCGVPNEGDTCRICSERAVYFARHVSVSLYDGPLRRSVRAYKFRGLRRLKDHLGTLAVRELRSREIPFDLVTFVPMNRRKKKKRGYNHSELIAGHIAAAFRKPLVRLFREASRSEIQKGLSLGDRFINAIDRFEVTGSVRAAGKNILIVDDVFTTGATLNECARTLKEAGAVKTCALTIAMTEINGIR